MPTIELETRIQAPAERVFDLARSIELHVASAGGSDEQAVAGRTSGMIGLGESVTWEATHFGVKQRLTARVTAFDRPRMFVDEMTEGAFAYLRHRHQFEACGAATVMRDRLDFAAPLGMLGRLFERLLLTAHMRRFLAGRNAVLKRVAEGDEWQRYVGPRPDPATGAE